MIRSNRDPRQRAEQEVRGLFAEDSALQEGISWARGALTAAGVDPGSQQLRAIRVLRESDQRLSLIAARYLPSQVLVPGPGMQRVERHHAYSTRTRATRRWDQ